jgi:hypothetical protein
MGKDKERNASNAVGRKKSEHDGLSLEKSRELALDSFHLEGTRAGVQRPTTRWVLYDG